MNDLPVCKLCGSIAHISHDFFADGEMTINQDADAYWCANGNCPSNDPAYTKAQWIKLNARAGGITPVTEEQLKELAMKPGVIVPYSEPYKPTRREYFAKAAMQGLLASHGDHKDSDILAKLSVKRADALIKELDK